VRGSTIASQYNPGLWLDELEAEADSGRPRHAASRRLPRAAKWAPIVAELPALKLQKVAQVPYCTVAVHSCASFGGLQ